MRFGSYVAVLGCLAVMVLATAAVAADKPFLHPLFCDNMVLQRDIEAPVWGWAQPGQEVTVSMCGKTATATAGADGKWMAKLGPFAAGGPFTLKVSGPHEVTLKNVMAGDVFICSGQSNMQMAVASSNNADAEIAGATNSSIRLFSVPNVIAYEPQELVNGSWAVCSPQTIPWFTAAGYFFGRTLQEDLKIPIGLINSSWGGTIAEAWVSGDALKREMPDFRQAVAEVEQVAADARLGAVDMDKKLAEWYAANDPGSAAMPGWADPALDDSDWKTMRLPSAWEDQGLDFDGIVWFRGELWVPDDWAGKDLTLSLGPIDDKDTTFVNGVQVGRLDQYNQPRVYTIPGKLVKRGLNVIAIRVLDTGGIGGINGLPLQMPCELTGHPEAGTIELATAWRYKTSRAMAEVTPVPVQAAGDNPNISTVLYNAMIAPLVPYGIKGAIWYQGESNAGRAEQYARLLPTLIRDWRARFGVGDFEFGIVHLANFMGQDGAPADDPWPNLRWAQYLTTKRVPNAVLALAIDIGDAADIHPKNKQEVGRRLALGFLATTYHKPIAYSGPEYRSMVVAGDKIRVSFDHANGGLVAKGGKLTGFAVAGADGKYVWADAVIDGDTVVVSSPQVPAPVSVRYAWSNNPVCNLYNQADLPAIPFATKVEW
jgi:sialate O-acetylesterase